jgi:hypothetical protein
MTLDEIKQLTKTQMTVALFDLQKLEKLINKLKEMDKTMAIMVEEEIGFYKGEPEKIINMALNLLELVCLKSNIKVESILSQVIDKVQKASQ